MNTPINNVYLGSSPMYFDDLDTQLSALEAQRKRLQQLKQIQNQPAVKFIWDEIDSEVNPLTNTQKELLFQDKEYYDTYTRLQELVQIELLNLVRGKIENTQEGKDLLTQQLRIVKKLKRDIIESTNKEMELFKKFREFSKSNPGVTYEEFVKSNM